MVGTCSSFYLFCTILIFFTSDSAIVLSDPGNGPGEHAIEIKKNSDDYEEKTEKYPFDKAYYAFNIQPDKLVKDARLNPPIDYKTPEGYVLKLEPVTHLCKVENASNIVSKFSAYKTQDKVYIKIDEDITITTNDSLIVYKLKVINETDSHSIGGDVTILVRIVKYRLMTDTVLEFEEPNYSIKLSYGRKNKVFQFKVLKTSHKMTEINDGELEFEKQPKNNKNFSRKIYPFNGNYSLEYVPDHLRAKLRISKDGDLEVLGNIDEGSYTFDVEAVDFGPNSTTVLRTRAKVNLYVDNIAVCNSTASYFIKAYSKHYITEETKLLTAVPATESNHNCTFAISHQYPLGVGEEFFHIDANSGAVHVVSPIDREAYSFEDMEEPSVYLKLKIHCPPPAEPNNIQPQPLNLFDVENIAYDPTTTLIRLVIVDTNDNAPVFPDKHMVVGYPVREVADAIVPKHLVQVKATDKDTGKHGKIQYLLRGNDAKDFIINPETGTVYCTRLVDDRDSNITFEVVAKDNDGKSEGLESVLTVTVKSLTYSDIIRVNVKFSTTEDYANVESELSEISDVRVISLTDDVINTQSADGQWRIERTLIVYGVNKKDGTLVSGSELEKKLANNAKIFKILKYSTGTDGEMSTGMSMVYAALICLALSMVAMSLFYFGYFKNGRYLTCISSMSTTPLKDDMENMSQSNWITTFNRSSLSSTRVRLSGNNNGSPVTRSKIIDLSAGTAENSLYEPIPPKANVSVDNATTSIIDSKLTVENELIKEEAISPTDDMASLTSELLFRRTKDTLSGSGLTT